HVRHSIGYGQTPVHLTVRKTKLRERARSDAEVRRRSENAAASPSETRERGLGEDCNGAPVTTLELLSWLIEHTPEIFGGGDGCRVAIAGLTPGEHAKLIVHAGVEGP